jgi:hypothetical protein
MRVNSSTRFAAMALLFGALACAGNTAREDTDETAAARDTTSDTTTTDTLGQNQPGYRGMETDTTIAPTGQQPSDTFIQNQGTGQPQDTSGYSGAERVDTTGQVNQQGQMDTTGAAAGADTTGAYGADTSATNQTGVDTTGAPTGDTTGYNPSQQQPDTTTSR